MKSIIFGILAFCIISLPSLAYSQYAINPTFDTTTSYLQFFSIDSSLSGGWNATCYNATGCTIMQTNSSYYEIMYLANSTGHTPYIYSSGSVNNTLIEVPAYHEAIINIKYLFNDTQTSAPYLQYTSDGGTIYNSTDLNSTPNAWRYGQLIIPALSINQKYYVFFVWFPSGVQQLAIDEFDFYTYDKVESRTTPLDTYEIETANYCGNGTFSLFRMDKSSVVEPFYNVLISAKANYSNLCCVYQFGSSVVARRCVYNFTANTWQYFYSRDLLWFRDWNAVYHDEDKNTMMIHGINPDYLRFSAKDTYNTTSYSSRFFFSGSGASVFKWWNINDFPEGISINTIYDWSSNNFSGSQFRLDSDNGATTIYTPYFPIFSASYMAENSGLNCESNQQYYVQPDGTIDNTSYINCGECGCSSPTAGCNFPSIVGTYCINYVANHSQDYLTENATCHQTYGHCAYGTECVQESISPNYISCRNLTTSETSYCIDSSGNNVACSSIVGNTTTSTNVFVNPANAIALMVGGLFGITNLPLAQNIASIVFTLTIAVALVFIMHKFGGVGGSGALQIMMISSFMMIMLFTMIGWLTPLIMVVILVLIALVLAMKLKF